MFVLTVKPLILEALNFCESMYYIILGDLYFDVLSK